MLVNVVAENVLEACIEALQRVPGIRAVRVLSDEERGRVLELEMKAERKVLMGLMPGINVGVREALSKKIVVAAITDMEFKWPDAPCVRLVCEGEEIGLEFKGGDPEEMRRKGYIVVGSFAIRKDKVRLLKEKREKCLLELLPLELPLLEGVKGVKRAVIGSPSPPADEYLKKLFNVWGEGLGTIIVGFDVEQA